MDDTRSQDERLLHYLESIRGPQRKGGDDDAGGRIWPRVECCSSSRSFYCPECCTVLIPRDDWPASIQNGSLALPFTLDIVLDAKERRTSSTGIQIMAIRNALATNCTRSQHQRDHEDLTRDTPSSRSSDSLWWRDANLYDLSRVQLPQYNDCDVQFEKQDPDDGSNTNIISEIGTYVLFPQKGKSVPISSVAGKLKRLVVLDIKWSKLGLITTNTPALTALPFVHLESPPPQSHFWRWHNAGDGMLSTAEAIYYAALEAGAARGWTEKEQDQIIDVMWLFALQRSIVGRRGVQAGRPAAYSKEGKARQISARMRGDGMDRPAQGKRAQKAPFYDGAPACSEEVNHS